MKYPKSVQPGIPQLSTNKIKNWSLTELGNVFEVIERPANIKDNEKYILVTVKRSRGGVEKRDELYGKQIKVKTQFFVKAGDFLISRRQIVHGACGIVPKDLDNAIVSNEYLILKPKENFDLDYLKFYSHSIYFQQTCFHASIGIHVEKMVFKPHWWFKFKHMFPPLPEQKKIAHILGTWDKAIEQTKQLIQAKQQLKKGLMQQLLTGRMRFGEFGNHEADGKGKGDIPVGWEKFRIKNIGQVITGSTPPKNKIKNYNGKYNWVTAVDMNTKYISRTKVTISDHGKKYIRLVPKGSILVTCIASIGKNGIAQIELATNQQINSIVINDSFYNEFIYYMLLFSNNRLISLAGLTAVPIVNKSEFENFELNVPKNKCEQIKIADLLCNCDRQIKLLTKKQQSLQKQKKGLMQKLLTGEVRV